ncbi:MAG TPA: hypothetical protein VKX17_08885 [Planctomycetota bacterium]|nr:hypothetical protein [Planctomycetota bacterium]
MNVRFLDIFGGDGSVRSDIDLEFFLFTEALNGLKVFIQDFLAKSDRRGVAAARFRLRKYVDVGENFRLLVSSFTLQADIDWLTVAIFVYNPKMPKLNAVIGPERDF